MDLAELERPVGPQLGGKIESRAQRGNENERECQWEAQKPAGPEVSAINASAAPKPP